MMYRSGLLVATVLLAIAGKAPAHDFTAGAIEVGHPFARATPPAARTGAGYFTLTNTGTTEDRLVAVTGEVAQRIEVHATSLTDGVARMRAVESIAIPPGETVQLAPGGMHLMLMGLRHPLVEGERVPIVLSFEKAGEVAVELAVEAIGPATAGGEHTAH
jgi:copper(I)-binding protein